MNVVYHVVDHEYRVFSPPFRLISSYISLLNGQWNISHIHTVPKEHTSPEQSSPMAPVRIFLVFALCALAAATPLKLSTSVRDGDDCNLQYGMKQCDGLPTRIPMDKDCSSELAEYKKDEAEWTLKAQVNENETQKKLDECVLIQFNKEAEELSKIIQGLEEGAGMDGSASDEMKRLAQNYYKAAFQEALGGCSIEPTGCSGNPKLSTSFNDTWGRKGYPYLKIPTDGSISADGCVHAEDMGFSEVGCKYRMAGMMTGAGTPLSHFDKLALCTKFGRANGARQLDLAIKSGKC